MTDNFRVTNYQDKTVFQTKCKFTIACEAVSLDGFVTEKILHAFIAGSIPIYFGSKGINKIFNEKAFINVHSYNSIDEVVERVKYIDNNDDAYYDMISQPIFNDYLMPYNMIIGFENFIVSIFSQEINKAKQRPEGYLGSVLPNCLRKYDEITQTKWFYLYSKAESVKRHLKKLL